MQSKLLTASALVAGASAANYLGFNSGSTHGSGAAKVESDFEKEFKTAQNLAGAPGDFNAVRLYTNIQGASTADPIEAFPAAVSTKTQLLLGIWTSGTDSIDNELNALKAGLGKYGDDLAKLIIVSPSAPRIFTVLVPPVSRTTPVLVLAPTPLSSSSRSSRASSPSTTSRSATSTPGTPGPMAPTLPSSRTSTGSELTSTPTTRPATTTPSTTPPPSSRWNVVTRFDGEN